MLLTGHPVLTELPNRFAKVSGSRLFPPFKRKTCVGHKGTPRRLRIAMCQTVCSADPLPPANLMKASEAPSRRSRSFVEIESSSFSPASNGRHSSSKALVYLSRYTLGNSHHWCCL